MAHQRRGTISPGIRGWRRLSPNRQRTSREDTCLERSFGSFALDVRNGRQERRLTRVIGSDSRLQRAGSGEVGSEQPAEWLWKHVVTLGLHLGVQWSGGQSVPATDSHRSLAEE